MVHLKVTIPSQVMGGRDHTPPIIPTYHLKHESEHINNKSNTIGNIVKISSQSNTISSDMIWQKRLGVSHNYVGIHSLRSVYAM